MSMNLCLQEGEDGPNVDLWQTPTFITYMCLSYDLETGEPDGGHKAVLKRYIMWLESLTDGVWKDREELEWQMERIKDHIATVRSVKDPYFYAM